MNVIRSSIAVTAVILTAGYVQRTLTSRLDFANSDKKSPFSPAQEKVVEKRWVWIWENDFSEQRQRFNPVTN